ncbi:MAG: acyl-CoA dehydrogenase family protein [Tsuneonella sp.]
MNFQFSEDAEALRTEARKFLAAESPNARARAVMDSASGIDEGLWRKIVDLGWTGLRIPEEHGGLGLSVLELCVLAEEVGRALTPVPFTSSVVLATEALLALGTPAQQAAWLPRLADGSATGAVALGEGMLPAGAQSRIAAGSGTVTGVKRPVPDAMLADFLIVAAQDGLHLVEKGARGLAVEPLDTVDLVRRSATVTLDRTPAEPLQGGREGLERFLQSAAVLLAFEGLGGAEAAMEMAIGYARERVAFGRPIAGYQAVKHRLADMYIKNQLARSHAYYGAWALSTGAPELPQAAAAARVAALDAYGFAAEENVQLHGGIGYTWESDCQFHYRRARLLSGMLGSKMHWEDALVRSLEQRNTMIAA